MLTIFRCPPGGHQIVLCSSNKQHKDWTSMYAENHSCWNFFSMVTDPWMFWLRTRSPARGPTFYWCAFMSNLCQRIRCNSQRRSCRNYSPQFVWRTAWHKACNLCKNFYFYTFYKLQPLCHLLLSLVTHKGIEYDSLRNLHTKFYAVLETNRINIAIEFTKKLNVQVAKQHFLPTLRVG